MLNIFLFSVSFFRSLNVSSLLLPFCRHLCIRRTRPTLQPNDSHWFRNLKTGSWFWKKKERTNLNAKRKNINLWMNSMRKNKLFLVLCLCRAYFWVVASAKGNSLKTNNNNDGGNFYLNELNNYIVKSIQNTDMICHSIATLGMQMYIISLSVWWPFQVKNFVSF